MRHRGRDHLTEQFDRDLRAGLQLARQIRIGEVLLHGEAVGAAAQAADHATIAQHRLPTINGQVFLAADHERTQPTLDCVSQEVPLGLLYAKTQARLVRVVEQAHVGAVVAVPLFHAERIEDPVTTGPDSEGHPGVQQSVPDLSGRRGFDVELPPQLADVGHALSEHWETGDPDRAGVHERKAGLGDVIARDAFEDLARARSPHADHRELIGGFAQVDGGIAVADLHAQPSEIAVHVTGSGDQAEVIRRDTRDGHIGGDSAVLLEQLRVDD